MSREWTIYVCPKCGWSAGTQPGAVCRGLGSAHPDPQKGVHPPTECNAVRVLEARAVQDERAEEARVEWRIRTGRFPSMTITEQEALKYAQPGDVIESRTVTEWRPRYQSRTLPDQHPTPREQENRAEFNEDVHLIRDLRNRIGERVNEGDGWDIVFESLTHAAAVSDALTRLLTNVLTRAQSESPERAGGLRMRTPDERKAYQDGFYAALDSVHKHSLDWACTTLRLMIESDEESPITDKSEAIRSVEALREPTPPEGVSEEDLERLQARVDQMAEGWCPCRNADTDWPALEADLRALLTSHASLKARVEEAEAQRNAMHQGREDVRYQLQRAEQEVARLTDALKSLQLGPDTLTPDGLKIVLAALAPTPTQGAEDG